MSVTRNVLKGTQFISLSFKRHALINHVKRFRVMSKKLRRFNKKNLIYFYPLSVAAWFR